MERSSARRGWKPESGEERVPAALQHGATSGHGHGHGHGRRPLSRSRRDISSAPPTPLFPPDAHAHAHQLRMRKLTFLPLLLLPFLLKKKKKEYNKTSLDCAQHLESSLLRLLGPDRADLLPCVTETELRGGTPAPRAQQTGLPFAGLRDLRPALRAQGWARPSCCSASKGGSSCPPPTPHPRGPSPVRQTGSHGQPCIPVSLGISRALPPELGKRANCLGTPIFMLMI